MIDLMRQQKEAMEKCKNRPKPNVTLKVTIDHMKDLKKMGKTMTAELAEIEREVRMRRPHLSEEPHEVDAHLSNDDNSMLECLEQDAPPAEEFGPPDMEQCEERIAYSTDSGKGTDLRPNYFQNYGMGGQMH